jgi:hypothetical protein
MLSPWCCGGLGPTQVCRFVSFLSSSTPHLESEKALKIEHAYSAQQLCPVAALL